MKRYYLCRRIGDGSDGNPYRSELRTWIYENYPEYHRRDSSTNPIFRQYICHTSPLAFMVWDLRDDVHAAAMAALQCYSFPAVGVNTTYGSLSLVVRSGIATRLTAIGLDASWIDASTTIGEIMEYLAHSIQLSEWLDVNISQFSIRQNIQDLSAAQKEKLRTRLLHIGSDIDINNMTSVQDAVLVLQSKLYGGRRYLFSAEE